MEYGNDRTHQPFKLSPTFASYQFRSRYELGTGTAWISSLSYPGSLQPASLPPVVLTEALVMKDLIQYETRAEMCCCFQSLLSAGIQRSRLTAERLVLKMLCHC